MFRLSKVVGVLAAVTLALTACGSRPADKDNSEDPASKYSSSVELDENYDPDAEIAFSWPLEATSWDPHQGVSDYDLTYLFAVYDRLIGVDPDDKKVPMLATDWEVTDTAITLKLRDGVSFNDGAPFNAEAVKINLDRARSADVSKIKAQLATITNVTAVDDLTVQIDISGKPGLVLGMLTSRAGMIASPAAINAGTLHTQPDGIGAYQATDIQLGDKVRFERTPDYWEPDAQRVAAMTYYYMPQAQTAVNALITGQIQIAHIEAEQIGDFNPDDSTILAGGFSSMQFIEVNNSAAPFDDPKVRLAMNLAIDRQAISEGLNDGLCEVPIQPWPASSVAYDETIGDGSEIWPHDPKKAKQLLAEAGYPDGFEFKAITSTVSYYAKLSEVIQANLADIGVTMDFEIAPRPQMVDSYSTKKTVPAMVAANPAHVDPEYTNLYVFQTGSVNNPGNPLPADQEALLTQAANEPDDAARNALYSQFMNLTLEEPTGFMPVCNADLIYALDPGISGIATYENSVRDMRGVAYTPQ